MFKVKNTNMHAMYIPPPIPKFLSLSLYDEPFLSYTPFLEKCAERPQMTLHVMFKVNNTNMHATSTPEAKLLSVSLYDDPCFNYALLFQKSAVDDPKRP